MSNREYLKLSIPTNRTVTGPKIRLDTQQLLLEYDYEHDNGAIDWAVLVFAEVLAVDFREHLCCKGEDVASRNVLLQINDSPWLQETLRMRRAHLGKQETGADEKRYAHFQVYFDDVACLQVIAGAWKEREYDPNANRDRSV